MMPIICALTRAGVNVGTASAARIAIIAITTSNSINVKALTRSRCFGILNRKEGLFIWIFIGVFFAFCGVFLRVCSEGFVVLGFVVGGRLFWGEHLRLFS